jgi:hypothetical protein
VSAVSDTADGVEDDPPQEDRRAEGCAWVRSTSPIQSSIRDRPIDADVAGSRKSISRASEIGTVHTSRACRSGWPPGSSAWMWRPNSVHTTAMSLAK